MYQRLSSVLLMAMSRLSTTLRSAVTRLVVVAAAGAILLTGCGSPTPNQASVLKDLINNNSTSEAALPGASGSGGSGSGGSGFALSGDCLGVLSAYSTIALALLPSLAGGHGTYDAGQLTQAIAGLKGNVPDALKADFATLADAAKAATGKSLEEAGQILGAPAVTAASDHISAWTDKNCGTG
ncbi:hypothetical protein ABIB25_002915 [Nakamurella sp. UYEF19]|uniref:hypothetical protein n=1 Tax=Nakamurella sp. UYEF19 TaxID=1756392 RepID=UPI00339AC797